MENTNVIIQTIAAGHGSLLDAMHALQKRDGYLSVEVMKELAGVYDRPLIQIYETAAFYSMFRLKPAGQNIIQICRNAPCHVAGAAQVIAAFENLLGMCMGSTSEDGKYTLEFVECLGQCQASPGVLINGVLHTGVTVDKVRTLVDELR